MKHIYQKMGEKMENSLINIDDIKAICENLKAESVESINFDELSEMLGEVQQLLDGHRKLTREINLLKEDYRNRIVGMLKANLACREDIEDNQLIGKLTGNVSEIKAKDLIDIYSRTAARFRTNFPSSFKYLRTARGIDSKMNWREHKI